MPAYLTFVRENLRFLAFGFSLTFSSSFGQTFVISLFGAQIRAEFGLSHGGFGLRYSVATLSSGLLLVWVGRLIDVVNLRRFTLIVCAARKGAQPRFIRSTSWSGRAGRCPGWRSASPVCP